MKKSFFLSFIYCSIVDYQGRFIDPVLYLNWVETIGFLIYTILWTINQKHHPTIQIAIHKILYSVLICELLLSLINSIVFSVIIADPKSIELFTFSSIVSVIMNVIVLCFSILLSTGLSIVFDTIPLKHIIFLIIISTMFGISLFLLEFLATVNLSFVSYIIVIVIFCIGYISYFAALMTFSKIAMNALNIHLEMIAERGINPNTSPSFKKINMLSFTRNVSVCLFFFLVICYVLYFIEIVSFWVIRLVKSIFVLFLFGIICYKCRIRQAMAATYGDEEDAYVVSNDPEEGGNENTGDNDRNLEMKNNENFNVINNEYKYTNKADNYQNNGDNKHKGDEDNEQSGVKWVPGTVLPPMPQLHSSSNKIYAKDPL